MLWQYIKEKMLEHPRQTMTEKGGGMNFEDLVVYAESFERQLRGKKCCAIYCSSEMVTGMALLACFAAEVTALPLSLRYGEAHCKKILNTISPDCIITDSNGDIRVYDISASSYIEPDVHPALIMCTSGTTGTPKGAMLTETNILTNLKDICKYFKVSSEDKFLIARPLYHCAVLTGEFLTALATGAEIIFCSEKFDPMGLIKILKKELVTVFGATPSLYNVLSRLVRDSLDMHLTKIVISGECMSDAVGKRIRSAFPNAEIYHVYGMTEASPRIAYLPPDEFDDTPDYVGIPLASLEAKILDDNGNEVGTGENGILYIKGDSVMAGYYNAPELTNKVLRDGWLRTGDIASINAHGRIKIKGRSDDMIIRAGMNIYPQEIEAEVKKDSRTKEVLVYGKYDEKRGSMQVAMKISGDFKSEKEVKDMCITLLPSFQVPEIIEIVDSLEKNGSGKIVRKRK